MSKIEIALPAMGEGIIEATITKWLVAVGDEVSEDQSLVEIATDKVDSEIPSPVAGKVSEILFKEGDVPQVGQIIAIIEDKSKGSTAGDNLKSTPVQHETQETEPINAPAAIIETTEKPLSGMLHKTSPLVRKIAKQEGLSEQELQQVKGTGLNERITRNDILDYISKRNIQTDKKIPSVSAESNQPASSAVEVIPMDRMRKLIAEHMVASKQTSAHVTSFIEADVTDLVSWRSANKDSFAKREGQKLTLTPLFVEAAVKALKEHPWVNSSIDGDNIIVKRNINIGLAAALPNGNLIVPVIKNADKLSLAGLAEKVNDLALRARNNKLQPDEIQGGTFTITNLGMFETLTGTPIINQPQVAILAIGSISKRVVVVESAHGDTIAIRQMAMLSLSYDHRVVDGALGGMFLKTVRDHLQQPR